MIPLMENPSQREARVLWSFWLSCGLAVTGGIAPLLLAAGGTNRIGGAVIPFGIAAGAMAACALLYDRGRPLATSLYFLAGIALVYGMLSMIAVPLRLAVLGTCPAPPTACPGGFEQALTTGENSGLAIGIAMGTLSILVGFFGLLMLYRIRTQLPAAPPPTRSVVPVRVTPPVVAAPPPKAEPESAAAVVAPPPEPEAPVSEPTPAASTPAPTPRKPRTKRPPKPAVDGTPPEPPLELPPPDEVLELPETGSPDKPAEDAPSSS